MFVWKKNWKLGTTLETSSFTNRLKLEIGNLKTYWI